MLSLQSLQAFLVINILDYGAGEYGAPGEEPLLVKWKSFETEIYHENGAQHVTRRTATQLGFTVPPRRLTAPSRPIE